MKYAIGDIVTFASPNGDVHTVEIEDISNDGMFTGFDPEDKAITYWGVEESILDVKPQEG